MVRIYCGWQVQPNGLAVQEVLNRCLSEFLGEQITTIGASRTDAGVHALGNVAVFDTEARMPADRISYALNTRLPEDIKIRESREASAGLSSRFQQTVKHTNTRFIISVFQIQPAAVCLLFTIIL